MTAALLTPRGWKARFAWWLAIPALLQACSDQVSDCPGRDCPAGFACQAGVCFETLCAGVDCPTGEACAKGACYPRDCARRTCPGVGEVCFEEECVPASCVRVDCPAGQRCAAGRCFPEDCPGQPCPGYGDVCFEEACTDRNCVDVRCPEGLGCSLGHCYPSDCEQADCAQGEVCLDGACQPSRCAGVQCEPGALCQEGFCRPVCDMPACDLANQCQVQDCEGRSWQCGWLPARDEPGWCSTPDGACSDGDGCTGPDACQGATCLGPLGCTEPDQARCEAEVLVTYDSPGSCVAGTCVYTEHRETCPQGCAAGRCNQDSCGGVSCDEGEQCVPGQGCLCGGSGPDCQAPRICCGTACVDPRTDDAHCGQCDRACQENQACVSRDCACQAGYGDCGPAAGCETALGTEADCTACGDACSAHENCAPAGCRCGGSGLDCGGTPNNYCCLGTEWGDLCLDMSTNAGACGPDCLVCPAHESCEGAQCVCHANYGDCNGQFGDGCETYTADNPLHCGACDHPCSAMQECLDGYCVCLAGSHDCNGDETDGCESNLCDDENCGGCGRDCTLSGQWCNSCMNCD